MLISIEALQTFESKDMMLAAAFTLTYVSLISYVLVLVTPQAGKGNIHFIMLWKFVAKIMNDVMNR